MPPGSGRSSWVSVWGGCWEDREERGEWSLVWCMLGLRPLFRIQREV